MGWGLYWRERVVDTARNGTSIINGNGSWTVGMGRCLRIIDVTWGVSKINGGTSTKGALALNLSLIWSINQMA